ncbi:MAG TPA: hypothetical protein VFX13_17760 [Gaiellales bacterium]|nr:hypothetical protein [Gaiellales bacterium]
MPRRTNLFQTVVAIIHEHMAGDAAVEESAMLTNRVTGELREVDVVVRSQVAGHEVLVGVEATATGRRADAPWVEKMIGKHADLPTSLLVLVSQAGFSSAARTLASAKGVSTLAPADLDEGDPVHTIVNAIPALWPKTVQFIPSGAKALISESQAGGGWVDVEAGYLLYLDDGEPIGHLLDVFNGLVHANFPKIIEQIDLASISKDMDTNFVLGVGPPWTVAIEGEGRILHLQLESAGITRLIPVEAAEFGGRAIIKVSRIDLTHRKLGEVAYAFGEGLIGEKSATVVVSENDAGGRLSVRLGPGSGR